MSTPLLRIGALSLAVLSGCGAEAPERSLNVLMVVLDTTRADAVGLGSDEARTPHLDALAEEGLVFTHARSTGAWTVPSHGSLFTGLYPSNHGAHHENPNLASEQWTLAELLASSHETAGFSENSFIQKGNGFAQGFEHFEETWRDREGFREPPSTLAKIRTWLDQRDRSRTFFLFVNLMTPHLPYDPPPRYESLFVPEGTSERAVNALRYLGDRGAQRYMMGSLELGEQSLELLRALYLADVAHADEQLGAIVEMVRAEGVLDDTLVVVVADHGENLGDHGLMEHQFSLHETLLRVPMVVRLPGVFAGGSESAAPVQLIDLVPTVLDIVGVSRERIEALDGLSLAESEPPLTRPVLAEFMRPIMQRKGYEALDPGFEFDRFDRRLKSLQIGNLKLIASDDGAVGLYDVVSDPGETTDLALDRPDELHVLNKQLEQWLQGSWEPGQRGDLQSLDDATLQELRSLGYVQ